MLIITIWYIAFGILNHFHINIFIHIYFGLCSQCFMTFNFLSDSPGVYFCTSFFLSFSLLKLVFVPFIWQILNLVWVPPQSVGIFDYVTLMYLLYLITKNILRLLIGETVADITHILLLIECITMFSITFHYEQ